MLLFLLLHAQGQGLTLRKYPLLFIKRATKGLKSAGYINVLSESAIIGREPPQDCLQIYYKPSIIEERRNDIMHSIIHI